MDISVIIPTFNRLSVLPRALRSVLRQKMPRAVQWEIIVADDGSTDGSAGTLKAQFPSIRIVSWPKQQGPSFARNRAVETARGRWIAFLDSDDEWRPLKLQTQLDFFKQHPDYRIAQTEEIWIRNGLRVNPMKKHRKFGGMIFQQCLPLCIISPSAVMLERQLFCDAGGFDESLPACEDYDLWLRLSARHPVGLIEKQLVVKYGGHPDQRSHEFQAMDRFRVYALDKILSSESLDEQQRLAALATLDEKTAILLSGALKRALPEDIELYENLRNKHHLTATA